MPDMSDTPDVLDFVQAVDLAAGLDGLSPDRLATFVGALESLKLQAFMLAARNQGSTEPPAPRPSTALDVQDVMRATGMSRAWLYREARTGRLPFARRIGRRLVFDAAGLEKWLARRSPR
jgi:predicted DNA-binding transcriptional regulator AlpA